MEKAIAFQCGQRVNIHYDGRDSKVVYTGKLVEVLYDGSVAIETDKGMVYERFQDISHV